MTSSQGIQERRKHHRFAIDEARVSLRKEGALVLFGLGGGNKAVGPVDLSEGGARIRTKKCLEPGSRVRVKIEFSKFQDSIEAEGEVRWSREDAKTRNEAHSGVMFLNLDPGHVKKIGRMRECFTSPHYRATQRTTR